MIQMIVNQTINDQAIAESRCLLCTTWRMLAPFALRRDLTPLCLADVHAEFMFTPLKSNNKDPMGEHTFSMRRISTRLCLGELTAVSATSSLGGRSSMN